LYDEEHPALLAGALHEQLSLSPSARAVVMAPLRDEATREFVSKFQEELCHQRQPLQCIEEGIVTGQDDWGEDEDGQTVDCWWAVINRHNSDTKEVD